MWKLFEILMIFELFLDQILWRARNKWKFLTFYLKCAKWGFTEIADFMRLCNSLDAFNAIALFRLLHTLIDKILARVAPMNHTYFGYWTNQVHVKPSVKCIQCWGLSVRSCHLQCIYNGDKTVWGWINIKMSSYQYRKSHCGDKTILWSSYLHNGISYADKLTSLYWIRALALIYWFL